MKKTSNNDLEQVRERVNKLKALLDDNETGLSSWWQFYGQHMEALCKLWRGSDCDIASTSDARGFRILVKHLTAIIPPEVAVKQLSGIPLVDSLKDYVFVPRQQWADVNTRLREYEK